MRHLLGALGGVLLAVVLFALLALLVAPPQDERQVIDTPVSVSMVESVEQPASEPSRSSSARPTPPPSTPPPPPAASMPSPSQESDIALPEPDMPPLQRPDRPSEMTLPELTQVTPKPTPDPEPAPRAQPTPTPAPTSESRETSTSAPPVAKAGADDAKSKPAPAPQGKVGSPQPTHQVPPEYPSRAQRRGIEGYVEVRFTIRPDGRVDADSLRVASAQPRNVFERAALRAISRWQFAPAASPREARQRLEFKLER